MAYVIGCLMAALSFLLNKLLLKYVGIKAVISYSPVVEEVTKSLCSYYLAADILVTHVVFGMLEAGYDWYNAADGQRGKWAALASIGGHTLFGCLTLFGLYISSSIWVAIFMASCVHVVWNVTLIRFSSS
ncbi:hypothetical protein [Pelosinus propionicus]|uniref:CAAX protease self-immunity n=1 Tax=Pelosinus propionicus DSM 13327 TaxID=1123291 RepID=A0A1I4LDF6_9FIRM|nr:hypothetical protein [Pelosinus propionicus]SFL88971.1 hypothetical protein SAMN04490355_102411 [Pelosinus propionicus DSM 13327]